VSFCTNIFPKPLSLPQTSPKLKHPITHNTYEIHQHQAGSKKTALSLNPFNLPTSIDFYSENKKIDYTYTASGQKTEQKTTDNGRLENRRQYAVSTPPTPYLLLQFSLLSLGQKKDG